MTSCRPCLIIIQSCYFDCRINKPFALSDPRLVICSRDLDVLHSQRIIGFFNLNYPQFNEVGKSDHIVLLFFSFPSPLHHSVPSLLHCFSFSHSSFSSTHSCFFFLCPLFLLCSIASLILSFPLLLYSFLFFLSLFLSSFSAALLLSFSHSLCSFFSLLLRHCPTTVLGTLN